MLEFLTSLSGTFYRGQDYKTLVTPFLRHKKERRSFWGHGSHRVRQAAAITQGQVFPSFSSTVISFHLTKVLIYLFYLYECRM